MQRLTKPHWTARVFWFVMMVVCLINTILILFGLPVGKIFLFAASLNFALTCLKWSAEGSWL